MSLVFTASEVMQILTMDLALAAVTEAFRAHGEGRVNMPPKVHLVLPRGSFKAMFGKIFLPDGRICGVKWNSNFPENPRHGDLTIKGKLLLNDPETGLELADMDATLIAYRTGAATGLAARYLARPESKVAGILACGVQGRTNLQDAIWRKTGSGPAPMPVLVRPDEALSGVQDSRLIAIEGRLLDRAHNNQEAMLFLEVEGHVFSAHFQTAEPRTALAHLENHSRLRPM